jgi:hypothetical protein
MCASPTSGSRVNDVLDLLWAAAQGLRAGVADPALPEVEAAPPAERPVARAVRAHLAAAIALRSGAVDSARDHADRADGLWAEVAAGVLTEAPQMAARSNAFHMRLAARHGDFYRDLGRKALLQWVDGAALKSRFLSALALHAAGAPDKALEAGIALVATWRASLPPRLPGLAVIEDATGLWATQQGRPEVAAADARPCGATRGPSGALARRRPPDLGAAPHRRGPAAVRLCRNAPLNWPDLPGHG